MSDKGEFLARALETLFRERGKADLLLKRLLRRENFGKRDRFEVTDAFFYAMRHFDQIAFFAESDSDYGARAKAALALAHGAANEIFPERSLAFEALSVSERNALQRSYPAYWRMVIARSYPSADVDLVEETLNQRAGVNLLVLARRQSRRDLMEKLTQKGLICSVNELSPVGLRVEGALRASDELFYDPQDESSQLIAALIAQDATKALDYCAGRGGKSVAMGTFWPLLKIFATDIRHELEIHAVERAKRAGVGLKWISKGRLAPESFDCVLVDAPCSGSGVWRRNPEDRFRVGEQEVAALVKSQRALLIEASRSIRRGGELIYATCSISREENEESVERFLASHGHMFTLVDAPRRLAENLSKPLAEIATRYYDGPYLRNRAAGGGDLFFAAILKKSL